MREVDAQGGMMALATDGAGIQFRVLNNCCSASNTGSQADRALYKAAIRIRLENQAHLHLFQGACDDLALHIVNLGVMKLSASAREALQTWLEDG